MIYIATYLCASPEDRRPLDYGDDPSFGSSQRLGGRLTWGAEHCFMGRDTQHSPNAESHSCSCCDDVEHLLKLPERLPERPVKQFS